MIGSSKFVYYFSSVNSKVCTSKPLDSEKPNDSELHTIPKNSSNSKYDCIIWHAL